MYLYMYIYMYIFVYTHPLELLKGCPRLSKASDPSGGLNGWLFEALDPWGLGV